MIKILLILLLFSTSANCQRSVLGILKNGLPPQPVLIIFWGESNATGYADNGLASGGELAARDLQILNNSNYNFESLDVGTNNILYAAGGVDNCPSCTTHGMEIGLANAYDDGDFDGHPVYLIKAGQGGSIISDWETTDAYYDSLESRITRGYNLILSATGQVPMIAIWGSQGVNNMIAGTSAATWKTAVKQFITDIRATIHTVTGQPSSVIPFLFTRFNSMSSNLAYETVIGEIEDEVSDFYAVSTSGAALKDINHWQYAGFLLFVPSFITITITYL